MTIGDGLVSQIPALIVSTAAGMLVSKAGVEGSADKALVSPARHATRKRWAWSRPPSWRAVALLPGMPIIAFAAYRVGRRRARLRAAKRTRRA